MASVIDVIGGHVVLKVELMEAFWVGDQVDFDDLCVGDGAVDDGEWSAVLADDDARGAVYERWSRES